MFTQLRFFNKLHIASTLIKSIMLIFFNNCKSFQIIITCTTNILQFLAFGFTP